MFYVFGILTFVIVHFGFTAAAVGVQDAVPISNQAVRVGNVDLTKDQVLQLMAANDAQLDNVRVEYERVSYPQPPRENSNLRFRSGGRVKLPYVVKADPEVDTSGIPNAETLLDLQDKYLRSAPGEPLPAVPEDVKKWVEWIGSGKVSVYLDQPPQEPFRFRAILGLRWPDFAVERGDSLHPNLTGKSYSKWRSIGQKIGYLDNLPMGKENRDWIVTTVKKPFEFNSYQEIVLLQKFALGIGYAQYITDVAELNRNNDRIRMRARIQIWPERISEAVLELDDSLIVRKATFSSKSTTITLDNDGEFFAGEQFRCAKNGRLERTLKSTGEVAEKFDIYLLSLQFNLSDEEFNRLADFSTPKTDRRFERDPPQSARPKVTRRGEPRGQPF
jgi:hypothetical protein